MRLLKCLFFLFFLITVLQVPAFAQGKKVQVFDWSDAYLYNFYSICPLSSGDIWIVGSHGLIIHYDPKAEKWIVQDAGTSENLYQVAFSDPDSGWIVSTDGRIFRTDNGGKTWKEQETPVEEHLFSISHVDDQTAWAVGCYGTILHTSDGGQNWHRQGEKIDRIYNKVHFVDHQYGWIAGEYGVIMHTEDGGKTWVEQKHDLGEVTFFSVHFKNRSQGWVTGMGGRMLMTKDGGKTWEKVDIPVEAHLFDVDCESDIGHCVGFKGVYLRSSSNQWSDFTDRIPNRSWLKDIVFLDENRGWTVGSVGVALYTEDGGQNWKSLPVQ